MQYVGIDWAYRRAAWCAKQADTRNWTRSGVHTARSLARRWGAASAARGLSRVDGYLRSTPAHADRRPLHERGGRAAGHTALDRPRARAARRSTGEACRAPLDLPPRSPRRGDHAARRSRRLDARRRRLRSLERYSTALLQGGKTERPDSPETPKSMP